MIDKRRILYIIIIIALICLRTYSRLNPPKPKSDTSLPVIKDVVYNEQQDFIIIAASIDDDSGGVVKAELHYGDNIIEMNSTSQVGDYVRYSTTIPLIDDNIKISIKAYDLNGNVAVYHIEEERK